MTDTIADFLTIIRNAMKANHRVVEVPASRTRAKLAEILRDKGYISAYKMVDTPDKQGMLKVGLKYDSVTRMPNIKKLVRVSKPGRRIYKDSQSLPRVLNGLGIAIVSTSKGVMTDKEARQQNVGGEVLCYIY